MMRLATIDLVATTEALRANLTNLPHFVTSINGDVDQVNSYFDLNYTQIIGCGSMVDDPISKLFNCYLPFPITTSRSTLLRSKMTTMMEC